MSEDRTPKTWDDKIADLKERQARAREMGGEFGLKKHRESGRLPVRERVGLLVDKDTFFEIGALALFLCRDEAQNVNGANWSVDGGWTAE